MSKKKGVEAEEPQADAPVEETVVPKKTGNLSESKSDKIGIGKYLQLHGSEIHRYTRASFVEEFRGIMKSKTEWDAEIKKIMEGDK